jgi:LPS-assembly protein
VKRKSGFLPPTYGSSSTYGVSIAVPYYWAIAPDYDATFTPMITTKQGPLLHGEWRQRLVSGSYYIRASGIFQLDKEAFLGTPGYQDFRGHVETSGKFSLSDKWSWGWDGWLISDKTYLQDYGLYKVRNSANLLLATPDYALRKATCRAAATAATSMCGHCISTASRRSTPRIRSRSSTRCSNTTTPSAGRSWAAN